MFAGLAAGCSSKRKIALTDGRTFELDEFHNDGRFLFFRHNDWEYTLPAAMLVGDKSKPPPDIRRVIVTTNRIYMTGWTFNRFDDLFVFLDVEPKPGRLVILELRDAAQWSKQVQEDFGTFYGKLEDRPFVGVEGCWGSTNR